ncbi:Cytosolic Fe-S cluster assembly factor nar-1 [Quillaja saponaria]|uniref:Cytosolic Fe-S cluster assembly factor nar-1 n=1 Tax=Quillaja saponaria TaxID=32244 RepID=A0AAD7M120_QUISA|nr:Cytosolic Fe-S cluster assembly factor nar-1 [Quillaja saponaria]
MNGYSKINIANSHKSRSIDFSESYPLPQTPKFIPNLSSKPMEATQMKSTMTQNCLTDQQEDEGENGENSGVVLTRSGSVSSSASGFQSAIKRAFSMRRSSSVSERYCRIHDQYLALTSPIEDDRVEETTRSTKKKNRGRKILKVCKNLFGL